MIWNETTDVIVVGCGFAGATAAIAAHDAGAEVMLLEKMPDPGGISICSGGGLRVASDARAAFAYLQATNAGTTPDEVLQVLAEGMVELPEQVETLAQINRAVVAHREAPAIYPFEGREVFGFCLIESIPDFDAQAAYPNVRTLGTGVLLFKVLHDNLNARGIAIRCNTAAERLVTGAGKEVLGLRVHEGGQSTTIQARRGIILACGGFEANPAMQAQYWEEKPVLATTFFGNTGDGIRMALDAGADLWHMWHYHGTYGFRTPDGRMGIRTKRLPDWSPSREKPDQETADASEDRDVLDRASGNRPAVPMPWILLDRDGRRFMNEYEPYMQDTGHRGLSRFRPETQDFPRIPCWLIADENGRQQFAWGQPLYNDRDINLTWSPDNLAEVEAGLIGRADSLPELAQALGVEPDALQEALSQWNTSCQQEDDPDFHRPPSSMMPVEQPPFYYAPVWPLVSNTQGGPVHDAAQHSLDPYGDPIPRLFAAGELGSAFGHLYLSGGNLAECLITGRIAGREAAALSAWE
ncbi:FAD-dependent oxidoreductase [Candidatus Entotheonella palauensis]|uniref:FAD-dependent oxidoreductase n=1 Tax=Candidatus Entotheonella palauensis TaxID=93172 RepID=UPI000B7ECCF0|nr:FAD-dependent oxidoreductase [Candidatus Entotheonella palauensis]